jgi:hypothetical protein
MGFEIQHSPAFAPIAQAAMTAGYGKFQQQQQQFAAAQQQQAIENEMRARGMALQASQTDQRFRYGVAQDQQQRQDRRDELQFNEQNRLRDMQFRKAMDDHNFAQEKQMLDLRQQRDEELIGFKQSAEDEVKIKQAERQKDSILKADWLTDEQKQFAVREVDAQMKIGPPIPRNMEAQNNFNSSMVTDPKTGRRFLVSGGNNTPRFEPMEADEAKIQAKQREDEQKLQIKEQQHFQNSVVRAETAYLNQVQKFNEGKATHERYINKLAMDGVDQYVKDNTVPARPATDDKPAVEGKSPTAEAIAAERNRLLGYYKQNLPFTGTEPNKQEFLAAQGIPLRDGAPLSPAQLQGYDAAAQAAGAVGNAAQNGPPQFAPQQQSLPEAMPQEVPPQQPNPIAGPAPMDMPVTPQDQPQAMPGQERQFILPDNHPAAPAYKEVRSQIPLGKSDSLNEDALSQDFQLANVKEGPKGIERLKTEVNSAATFIKDVDLGRAKLKTPEDLEKFRLAAKLLMKYVSPRNQR